MRFAFSMPVHERTDAILDSVRNILHFNPGSVVVLHVSQQAKGLEDLAGHASEQLIINPRRYRTFNGGGVLLMHCANYRHLCEQNVDFDTFCIISSNELFVQKGLDQYAARVKNAFQAVPADPAEDWHVFEKCRDRPKMVADLLKACGGSMLYGGQTEGQFFTRETFRRITEVYETVFGEDENVGMTLEEIVPPTVAMAEKLSPQPPFTLVDYSHMAFEVDRRAITLLTDPQRVGAVRLNLGVKRPLLLRSPHAGATNELVFAVKRIPRDPAHPLREAVRGQLSPGAASVDGGNKRRPVPLVSIWSYRRWLSGFIAFCARLGLKIRLTTGVRTMWRRWFQRSR